MAKPAEHPKSSLTLAVGVAMDGYLFKPIIFPAKPHLLPLSLMMTLLSLPACDSATPKPPANTGANTSTYTSGAYDAGAYTSPLGSMGSYNPGGGTSGNIQIRTSNGSSMLMAVVNQPINWQFIASDSMNASANVVVFRIDLTSAPQGITVLNNNSASAAVTGTPLSQTPTSGSIDVWARDSTQCSAYQFTQSCPSDTKQTFSWSFNGAAGTGNILGNLGNLGSTAGATTDSLIKASVAQTAIQAVLSLLTCLGPNSCAGLQNQQLQNQVGNGSALFNNGGIYPNNWNAGGGVPANLGGYAPWGTTTPNGQAMGATQCQQNYYSAASCQGASQLGCAWNGTSCQYNGSAPGSTGNCSLYNNNSSGCASAGCSYTSTTGSCVQAGAGGTGDCSQYNNNSSLCSPSRGCSYNNVTGYCSQSPGAGAGGGTNCANYPLSGVNNCDAHPKCQSHNGQCVPLP